MTKLRKQSFRSNRIAAAVSYWSNYTQSGDPFVLSVFENCCSRKKSSSTCVLSRVFPYRIRYETAIAIFIADYMHS